MKVRRRFVIFALIMAAIGFFQLADWYFGSEDPIWHVFFYIILIPVISFVFAVSIPDKGLVLYSFPLYCVLCTAVIYVFMANGGNAVIHGYVYQPGFFQGIGVILLGPFVGGFLGIVIRLIILYLRRRLGR